ncbi:hypothetical protein, partial [Salmonella sp. SAL4446]|uniref:hypothetical protein n=1 Tax=Salmonella sp. SAL4446 TaxID=3159901 RepID=UPI00397DC219
LQPIWLRVPVYAGEAAGIDRRKPVRVAPLGAPAGGTQLLARPVVAPPTADASASTVDLYYELENRDGRLHPGERLAVSLPSG